MTEMLYTILPRNTASPRNLKFRRRVNASDKTASTRADDVADIPGHALEESDFGVLLRTRRRRQHLIDTTA